MRFCAHEQAKLCSGGAKASTLEARSGWGQDVGATVELYSVPPEARLNALRARSTLT